MSASVCVMYCMCVVLCVKCVLELHDNKDDIRITL